MSALTWGKWMPADQISDTNASATDIETHPLLAKPPVQ